MIDIAVSRPDLTFLASYVNTSFVNSSEHLTCFDGGNILLGGSALGRQDYIDFGLALVNGCHDTYNSTLTGIGPEQFSWDTTGVDSANEAFYNANGFYITNPLYDLRPEVIESFYYAYRITGRPIMPLSRDELDILISTERQHDIPRLGLGSLRSH